MYESEIIEPSNLSVSNCNFNDNYQGYNEVPFAYSERPKNEVGYTILNPQLVKNKYDTDFDRINVDGKCVYITSVPDGSVKFNQNDGQYSLLDLPARDSGLGLNELDKMYTDDSFNNYKTGYRQYKHIQGGDITYYINKQNQEPFFSPIFSGDFNTTSVMYKDPMGGLRPQYLRYSNNSTNKITNRNSFEYNLSWIEDSNEYREDLLARRIQKLNENRWNARWNSSE